jgi:hypothetical protein
MPKASFRFILNWSPLLSVGERVTCMVFVKLHQLNMQFAQCVNCVIFCLTKGGQCVNDVIILWNSVTIPGIGTASCITYKQTVMNISQIHEGHHKFLMQSVKFCEAIGPFVKLLGLNIKEVTIFKEDILAVLYIAEHYKSFADSFILYNKGVLQKRMAILINDCLRSVNYTKSIGEVLGIEEQAKINGATYLELEFHISCKN